MSRLLEIRNLVIHFHTDYGVVQAIDKLDLVMNSGEIVGLIGESGCGKTTTARAILGVIPSPPGEILEGQIIFRGQDLLDMNERELSLLIRGRAITLIPQDPFNSLNPLFAVEDQIADIMRWKSHSLDSNVGDAKRRFQVIPRNRLRKDKTSDRQKMINMLKQMQIPSPERQVARYPHEFSGGQRQRIMISMALLPNPSLMIADEPTTALDVTIEAQILRLLKQVVKDYEVSVLYITHDLGVASQICDRLVIMYAGQIMETAPVAPFFAKPLHPYTRKLLDSLPNPNRDIRDIPGEVPHLINPPSGCRFHTRCEFVDSNCKRERPVAQEVFPEHWVHCFKPVLQ